MKIPRPIVRLIESFERLPGIGPKTAQRLVFHLLHFPDYELERFAEALTGLKSGVKLCTICKNVSEDEVCEVCSDSSRDANTILVVASPLDVFAYSGTDYAGTFHVLHGLVEPLNNIGPEDIFIENLINRVNIASQNLPVEVILSTNMSMEGESTAMYIAKQIKELNNEYIKVSRIARGLPVGGDIEYADNITLNRALEGRGEY